MKSIAAVGNFVEFCGRVSILPFPAPWKSYEGRRDDVQVDQSLERPKTPAAPHLALD